MAGPTADEGMFAVAVGVALTYVIVGVVFFGVGYLIGRLVL
jgi:hypothetical protein